MEISAAEKQKDNTKYRKAFIVVSRILICMTVGEIVVLWLNRRYDESWSLFACDLQSRFVDNQEYLKKFVIIYGTFLLLYLFYIMCSRDGIFVTWRIRAGGGQKYEWNICISGKRWKIFLFWDFQIILLLAFLFFVGFTGMIYRGFENIEEKFNLWNGSNIIAHAFGGIDDYPYTNSLEAFEENYNKGCRTFEVDFEITSDDKIVLRHYWDQEIQIGISSEHIPTEEEFLAVPILEKYTPMSFSDLCLLMKEHTDIWIVTDTKYTDKENIRKQFNTMLQTAEECNAVDVLDRMVVQIYNEEMYEQLKEIYPFKSFIFTLYMRWNGDTEEFTDICRWCVNHNLDAITMWDYLSNEENREIAERYNRDIYVHTVNDISEAQEFIKEGIKGIYTDDIYPKRLEEEK
ncbi:MAG: hypothetical protein K2H31_00955 [Lachnospiraceae bacterium]|nr:hypothetical protein [Lachnospiraceae bacterium]